MNKKMIAELNEMALENFDRAQAMLDGINMVLGTKYGWLRKRVVFFDDPDATTCVKYAHAHDALAYATE